MIRACPDVDQFLATSQLLGHKVFTSGLFNLNIVGWRNRQGTLNKFEDWITVYRKTDGDMWTQDFWPATTKPGIPYLLKPLSKKGTAIVYPGQHTNSYALGHFKGYQALRQVGPIKVFRDDVIDGDIDYSYTKIESGLFGIHIHKAGLLSKIVGAWSAGCQVFANKQDFDEFIALCKMASQLWGNKFTYTLIEY